MKTHIQYIYSSNKYCTSEEENACVFICCIIYIQPYSTDHHVPNSHHTRILLVQNLVVPIKHNNNYTQLIEYI